MPKPTTKKTASVVVREPSKKRLVRIAEKLSCTVPELIDAISRMVDRSKLTPDMIRSGQLLAVWLDDDAVSRRFANSKKAEIRDLEVTEADVVAMAAQRLDMSMSNVMKYGGVAYAEQMCARI